MKEARCFIDSNVWIYSLTDDDLVKREKARELIKANRYDICFSVQVVNEVCSNLLRKSNKTEAFLQKLTRSFFRRYDIVHLDENILLKASELRTKHSFSFWDSLVAASALISECEVLYSKDMQDGFMVKNKLRIINPFR